MKAWMIALTITSSIVGMAGTAAAQPIQEWPITVQPAAGNAATCNPGASGARIRVKDGAMSLVFAQYPEPIWTITLAADGSFDAIAKTLADTKGTKITVPKGTAPREIYTLQQSQACGYRLVPA
jgi:hypothetical protein